MQLPGKTRPSCVAIVVSCAALLFAVTPMMAQEATSASVPAASSVRGVPLPGAADQVGLLLPTLGAVRTPFMTVRPAAALPTDASALPTGPRVRPDIRGVEPLLTDDDATAWPAAAPKNNTIVISTLALVLIAVIVTILVVD